MARKAYSGKYTLINEDKYIGDPGTIAYRSSWERVFHRHLDLNNNVKKWSSEEIIIEYYYPLDEKMHRYFPDYYVEFTNGKKAVIEIKPHAETLQPVYKPGQNKRVFGDRMATYVKNIAKWEAAKIFCQNRGWEFHVFTEKTLALLK